MATFGPVYYYRWSVINTVNEFFNCPLTDVTVPPPRTGFFQDEDADKDEKFVVHAKPVVPLGGRYRGMLESGGYQLPFFFKRSYKLSSAPAIWVAWYSCGPRAIIMTVNNSFSSNTRVEIKYLSSSLRYSDGRRGMHSSSWELGNTGGLKNPSGKVPLLLSLCLRGEGTWERRGSRTYVTEWGVNAMLETVVPLIEDGEELFSVVPQSMTRWSTSSWTWVPADQCREAFLFGEDNIPDFGRPFNLGSTSNYWLNLARSRAFVDACSAMPRLSDNSISNLTEIFEFLLAIVRHEPPKLSLKPNDLWLSYRYVYNTTKADLSEAWSFVNRYYDLGSLLGWVDSHGKYSFDYQGQRVTCRCSLRVRPAIKRSRHDLAALWRTLSTYGLAPDLYYLWDSTPFSFIVDWALPIGSIAEGIDASMLYNETFYEFDKIVYSISYRLDSGVSCYSRWKESSSPEVSPFYFIESSQPSRKQVLYRTLDSASLLLGAMH